MAEKTKTSKPKYHLHVTAIFKGGKKGDESERKFYVSIPRGIAKDKQRDLYLAKVNKKLTDHEKGMLSDLGVCFKHATDEKYQPSFLREMNNKMIVNRNGFIDYEK